MIDILQGINQALLSQRLEVSERLINENTRKLTLISSKPLNKIIRVTQYYCLHFRKIVESSEISILEIAKYL